MTMRFQGENLRAPIMHLCNNHLNFMEYRGGKTTEGLNSKALGSLSIPNPLYYRWQVQKTCFESMAEDARIRQS